MLLVEMSVVTTISFLAHLVPALRIYIYIYARTVHADAHSHTYKQHGRVQLCAPVLNYSSPRETASLLFLSPFLLRSGRARTPPTLVPFPHPRPLPPPLGFSLSFLSFLLFSLLLPIFSSRLQSSQEEIRPLGSRNILENIFDFSREPLSRDFSAKKFLFVVESFLFSLSFFLSKKFSSKGEKRFPCTLSRENNRFREAAYLEFLPRI